MIRLALSIPTWGELRDGPWYWAFVAILVVGGVLATFAAVYAGVATLMERKIAGHMQHRVGPYRVGWHGSLQWIADALKLLVKEDIVPKSADGLLFRMAPYVVFAGSFAAWCALPFTGNWSPAFMNIGILYILAVSAAVVIGILMSGWSSGSKWSLFGAMRSAAQIVSYEVPAGLVLLGMLMLYGTLDMRAISMAQERGGPFGFSPEWYGGMMSWGLFRYLPFTIVAFLVYYTAALAETNRTPFDIPEAESELVAGYHTEYSGMRFAFFFLSEYANMFVVSAIAATFFLGGSLPPYGHLFGAKAYLAADGTALQVIESLFWFFSKVFFLIFVMMWLRWTLPRYRVDQLMELCWKKLVPLALICMMAIGVSEVDKRAGIALASVFGLVLLVLLVKEVIAPSKVPPPLPRVNETGGQP